MVTSPRVLTPGPRVSGLPAGALGNLDEAPVQADASLAADASAAQAGASSGPGLSRAHRSAIGASHLGITQAEYQRHIDAGERRCGACQAWHPMSEMAKRATRMDGLDNVCKRVSRARARFNMARLRTQRRAS